MSANTTEQLERAVMAYQQECKDLRARLQTEEQQIETLRGSLNEAEFHADNYRRSFEEMKAASIESANRANAAEQQLGQVRDLLSEVLSDGLLTNVKAWRLRAEAALSATPSDGCGKGRTDKPLRDKSDECPYEVPAFEMPKKPQGKYPYFWWSWHPNYPYWSNSCWGGNTVDLALKALKEPHACSMRYYHNVLVDDETGKVVHELPCQRLDVWRDIAVKAASSSGEEGGR